MSPMCFRFFRVPLVRNGVAALSLASLLVCPSGAVSPVEPAWWAQYEAVDPYGQSDDFAAANVGQLKYIASRAAAALNDAEAAALVPLNASQLQAKTAIDAMLAMWNQPPLPDVSRDDFQALNAGQLKQVASLFYDRLGLPHPWPAVSTDDHQMVNVGQLKHVFAFDPRFRGAVVAATIPASLLQAAVDAWNALPTKPAGSSLDDFDGDGNPNLQQYLSGRPLLDPADLDGDRIPDSVETASGGILDPLRFADAVADYDNDGVMNHEELLLALTLGSATTPARTDTLEDAAVLVWSLPLGRPLIPRVDPLRTFWEGIDAAWLDEQVGPGYESWLEDQDLNTNGLPDGLEAFRTAALVDFTWSPYPDIGTIQYPPLAYDPAGGTIDADQDGNPDFDRDADTLPDLWEYRYQLDPRDPGDATLDPDQDGLNNLAEYLAGTHPRLADSDGDGFTDGEEWNASSPASNPLAAASVPPLVLAIGSGSGQQIPVGSTSAAPLIAHVTQGARPRQGAAVTFSMTSGGGWLYSTSVAQASTSLTLNTDTQGNAVVNLLAGSTTGPAVVTATLPSGGQAVTFALTITAAPPAYGIGSPASPYGTPSGAQSVQSNPFDNWDSIYVIEAHKSLLASFSEIEQEDAEPWSGFGGHIANIYSPHYYTHQLPEAETDKTPQAIDAFKQEPFYPQGSPYNHSLGTGWNSIILPDYAISDTTWPLFGPDGEQRHKWTSWGVTSLRFGTYSPQLRLNLSFLVLVETDTESAYANAPSDQKKIIASGSLRFQDRSVSWSENLNDFLTKGKNPGEVILDPGKKASQYLGSTKTGNIAIRLLPVEIDSRDRAVTGKIPHLGTTMGGNKKFEIGFRGAGKNIGKYEIPQSGSPQGVHIYNSEEDIYSDSEFEAGVTATNKNQEVVLIREGDGIRFYTVSDDLGQFEVLLYLDGSLIGTVTHEMKKEDGFDRMIAAAEKFIAGDDPLPIDVDYTEPPPPLAAADVPPLGDDDRQNLADNAPADVLGEFGLGSTTTAASSSEAGTTATTTSSTTTTAVTVWTDKEEFQLFVQRVFDEATTTQWTVFSGVLTNAGYNVNQALGNGQPGFNWQPGGVPATRTDIDMPDHIRNRGLVARALMYWIKRLITAHVAVGEGAVFGVWDGVKGDVDGVVETLKMPVTVFNIMKDPWKAAGELHGAFKTIKEMGWDGVKQQVKGMFDSFMVEQQGRLEWVLEGDAQDPVYLNAYMGGYLGGYIGEQVAVTVLTAGIAKGGLVGKALKQGAQIVTTTLNNAGDVGRRLHKASKSLADAFSRTARSANEGRAARRSGSLCGSINGCLAAGTYVLMANGSARLIDDVHGGDSILADDPNDGLPPFAVAVETQIANRATSWIALGCDFNNDRKVDQTLKLTPEHPVFLVAGGWSRAADVLTGDVVLSPDGHHVTVCEARSFTTDTASFNLDVGNPNTFFVSADAQNWILVHNGEFDIGPYYKKDEPWKRHHGIMNKWLEVHLPFTYQSRASASSFPCISLSKADHDLATSMERNFMRGRSYHDVSAYEAKKLCEQIFDAVGVPGPMRTFYFQTMNIWLHKKHLPTCP